MIIAKIALNEQFKWVNCIINELYFNKVTFKNSTG